MQAKHCDTSVSFWKCNFNTEVDARCRFENMLTFESYCRFCINKEMTEAVSEAAEKREVELDINPL